ncbi:MAG: hemoglobin-like flavoprotein [Flavobacteriales bacterium]|jgi:hemoglobin-like flavoprotein
METMTFEAIFDASYERTIKNYQGDGDFFEAFYEHFLNCSPLIRKHFENSNMHMQQRMLKKSFYSLVVFYASGSVDNVLSTMAERHSVSQKSIPPELYDLWLESLILTVRDFDTKFDDEIELAWRLVLSGGITYMKFKFNH